MTLKSFCAGTNKTGCLDLLRWDDEGFLWCLSPGFLILTLANLLITHCWGYWFEISALRKAAPLFGQLAWRKKEKKEEEEGVIQSVLTHTHSEDKKSMRHHVHLHQSRQLGHISKVWPAKKHVFIQKTQRESLCFFWWQSTGGRARCYSSHVFPMCVITRLLVCLGPHIVVSHQVCFGPRMVRQQICL